MNKNIRRMLGSHNGIYLIMLVVFTAVTFLLGFFLLQGSEAGRLLMYISAAELLISVALLVFYFISRRRSQKELVSYIESAAYDSDNAKSATLMNFPLPIAVFHLGDSRIVWANDMFFSICGNSGNRLDARISDLVEGFSVKWLMEGKSQFPSLLTLSGRKYRVHGNIIRQEGDDDPAAYMGITYWLDITEYDDIKIEYEETRPAACVIILDNLEELIRNLTDREKNNIRDTIEDILTEWGSAYKGIVRRYERDRYIGIFEKRDLDRMIEEKFSILEKIHAVESPSGIKATLSIGFGVDASSLGEALQFADMASELALSRGGDQTVVKNRLNFSFYGGRGNEVERRTKVKSRVMATTLKELVKDSSKIYVMGHRYADLDCLGAAIGVCCLARQCGIKFNIVMDAENNASKPLLEKLAEEEDYKDAVISTQEAILHADGRTLLVIVDTNRPEQVEDPDLLDACNRVAVIDHHRVAATYIHNAALGFIEPYASSTCELMTEVLQDVVESGTISKFEAEALLTGIVLDTKNFTLRTGERTFDAASFLRHIGADTVEVKKMLQSGMEDTVAKFKILQNMQLYRGVAIAAPSNPTDRIVAAKAADDMLNVSGVEASVVVAPAAEGGCLASARSIGEMNVQILMEKLGGGGNRNAAAAQLPDKEIAEAMDLLYKSIDEYLGEN